jgi:ketosteroid isomerase-like protein
MTRLSVALVILGLAALASCTQAPAPVTAPPDTREADAKAIRDSEVAWNKDWAAKDVEKIVSHYADDASVEIPNIPIMTGKTVITDGFKGLLTDPNLALTFEASQVEVSKGGDLAYTRGTYSMTMSDSKTKKPVVEKGKYVTVYRKLADGSWKAVQDINNADPPAPPAK